MQLQGSGESVMDGTTYSTLEVRVRAVRAVLSGLSVVAVAHAYQTDRTTVHRWLKRFHESETEDSLQRRPTSGRPRKLSSLDEHDLKNIVLSPATQFGFETDLWTVRRLCTVLWEQFNESISEDTVWRRLREAGLTWQVPERQYFQADLAQRAEWMDEILPEIRRAVANLGAILYCQDEASVALTPFLGRTWAERAHPRKVLVTGSRASVAAMSALSPRGRLVFQLHQKRIASPEVIAFLGQLLKQHPRRHVVVVMDQAPPHTSKKTMAYITSQRRLYVFYLPKYSPDWNPDEKVWNHLKNHELKAHRAKNKQELYDLTQRKLESMSQNKDLLQGLYFRCCVAELLR
jgi:transposase